MLSDLACQNCGAGFRAQRRDAKWCEACRVQQQRKAVRDAYRKRREQHPPEPLVVHCADCGIAFPADRKDTERCVSCKQIRKNNLAIAGRIRRRKPNMVPCQNCGNTFDAKRTTTRTCDACKTKQAAEKRVVHKISVVACIDCRNTFNAKRTDARRCSSCNVLHRKQYTQEYEHGKVRGKCIDCGADIGARARRCRVCDNKARSTYMQGERVANWKGGKSKAAEYVLVRTDPSKKGSAAYRPEHHVVWERTHGKPLPKGWIVHHLNGVKDDNRPENLAGMSRHEHHHHPREALRPYEARIRQLEQELKAIQQLRFSE